MPMKFESVDSDEGKLRISQFGVRGLAAKEVTAPTGPGKNNSGELPLIVR
jgi:hypothetical protein